MSKPSLICHNLIFSWFSGVCGHEEAAYSLAEHYQDFANLVALCHRETVFPPEENPNAERIQSYIQQFKEDFTTELFQWYIQHGGYSQYITIV